MRKNELQNSSFNALDLFLLFLIVLSVAAFLLRQYSPQKNQRESVELTLTLRVEQLREETISCLSVGDSLYNAAGEDFGNITQLEVSMAEVSIFSEGVFYSDVPSGSELFDLTLQVSVSGSRSGDVFLQDGKFPLLLGKEISLYSNLTVLNAKITEIRESKR